MVRKHLANKGIGIEAGFRMRGGEISRIEGFSDAVFAFAVTLLVVSLEVPKTFSELLETMRGFAAFGIAFAVLVVIWYQQYKYFRRYGLEDVSTIVLTGILLFVVLFFVYPLKFLFSILINMFMGKETDVILPSGMHIPAIEGSQVTTLMSIYGAGYIAIFLTFALLYVHAYRKRAELDLNELEQFDTLSSIREQLIHIGIATLSISIVWFGGPRWAGWAGWSYALVGPAMTIHGSISGKKRKTLQHSPH